MSKLSSTLPKIVQVDFKTLRTPAAPVPLDQIKTPEVQSFIKLMVDVMREAPGVGLAAPQIGDSRQIIVLEDRQEYIDLRMATEESEKRGRYAFPLKVIINPKLTLLNSDEPNHTAQFAEGCLSVEGYMGEVDRALHVRVDGWDENANPFQWEVSGWPARILQHEVDHLNSTLYIDRMDRATFRTFLRTTALASESEESDKNPDPSPSSHSNAPLEMLTIGNPILRAKSQAVPLEDIKSAEIQTIISKMISVVRTLPLVGMGAPQIGISKRIIVLEDRDEIIQSQLTEKDREIKKRYPFPLKVIVNPQLNWSKLNAVDHQKPLSASFPESSPCVPGYQACVERQLEVQVEGWDEKGNPLKWQVHGWPARILQHEIDYLDGIIFTDRMDSKTFKSLL